MNFLRNSRYYICTKEIRQKTPPFWPSHKISASATPSCRVRHLMINNLAYDLGLDIDLRIGPLGKANRRGHEL